MPLFDKSYAKPCTYVVVAVSKSTSTTNASTPSDSIVGRDYLERIHVISASTALPGAVSVLDGDTTLLTHNAQITGYVGSNIKTYELGLIATTTKGFNITTGASVTVLAIGRFH